jgi:MarR-like DNA-binding transcriptional regulator SgrR of sgrS sRNA
LDALEGRLDGRECDAPTLADVHVWLLLFADDLALTSESKVGLQQQLDALQQFCAEHGLTVNVKKTKVMVFNYVDPCQKFVFEGDIIEHVQTFNYLGILLNTTPNLDSVVEHLATASRRSLFALNNRCAELRIMDVKLRCDLFNTLVRSIASYACEI